MPSISGSHWAALSLIDAAERQAQIFLCKEEVPGLIPCGRGGKRCPLAVGATRLAVKLHAHSVQYTVALKNFLAPLANVLLRRLLSTLVTKIRHGLLLVTLLIPIDFFLLFFLVKRYAAPRP
eukprot:1150007-Pelagomonas_calceolata.AAC.1